MNKWDYIIETIEQNFGCKYNYNDTQGMHEFGFGDEVLSFYDNFNDHGEVEILNEFCSTFAKIAEKMDEIKHDEKLGSCGDCWLDYNTDDYINDVVSCIADSNTSIYYSDILDFIRQNPETLADVVDEGLYEVGNGKYDLYKHGQAAEYLTIERELYDNMQDIITYAVLHQLINDGYEIINVDDYEILRDIASDYNNYDTAQDIIDEVYSQLMLTSDRVCKSNCIR